MPPIALTMGDPAGIGGELTLRAWLSRATAPFIALDDPDRLTAMAARLHLPVPVHEIHAPSEAAAIFPHALPVLPVRLAAPAPPGRPDPANAPAVIASIERATALALRGEAGAVVTNPINKAALYAAGFAHPGHTEFLAELTGVPGQEVMMLAAPALRVVPVSVHVSLRDAIAMLDADRIVAAARTTAAARSASRTPPSLPPPSPPCGPRASTPPAPIRPTPCSPRPRAPPMTWPSACTTIRP
jgi:4-hydroxythreonine-4-phosphate dehydrogenase